MKFMKKWIDVILTFFIFIGLVLAMFNGEWLSFIATILFLSYIQLTKISYDLESMRDFQVSVIRAVLGHRIGRKNSDEKDNQ